MEDKLVRELQFLAPAIIGICLLVISIAVIRVVFRKLRRIGALLFALVGVIGFGAILYYFLVKLGVLCRLIDWC